ncbi:ARF GTPase activator, partial [Trifolium pratense]
RTTSLQSTDSNLSTLRSYNSVGSVDFFSEAVQSSGSLQDKALGVSLTSGPVRSVSFDRSKAQVASASSVDLFQTAAPSQSALGDLFQLSDMEAAPSFNGNQPLQTSQVASVNFFVDIPQQPSAATSDAKSAELSVPKNEGWATFDTPQFTSSTAQVEVPVAAFNTPQFTSSTAQVEIPAAAFDTSQFTSSTAQVEISAAAFDTPQFTSSTAQVEFPAAAAAPSSAESLQGRFDPFSNANMQWPSFEISSAGVPSSVTSNVWHDGVWNGEKQVPVMATNTQPWNAFEDSGTHLPVDGNNQGLQLHNFPSESFGLNASERPSNDGIQGVAPIGGFDNHEFLSNGDIQHNGINRKSTNPFDFPFDSDVDQSDMFLDMSSLQAALPDALLPAAFGGIAEPWLPQNTATPYISSAGEGKPGNLNRKWFLIHDSANAKLSITSIFALALHELHVDRNIQAQEPVASVGGNPFA